MLKIEELKFDEKGLIPAIVVDVWSKEVLTLAYMNAESLEITLKEGRTCFGVEVGKNFGEKGKRVEISKKSYP